MTNRSRQKYFFSFEKFTSETTYDQGKVEPVGSAMVEEALEDQKLAEELRVEEA